MARPAAGALDTLSFSTSRQKTNLLGVLLGIAVALVGQNAAAKNRLTDPMKIARECKSETEQFCKDVRPGRQRIMACLRGKTAELSPACLTALKSTE
jgi:cysteine rich repeat protein